MQKMTCVAVGLFDGSRALQSLIKLLIATGHSSGTLGSRNAPLIGNS